MKTQMMRKIAVVMTSSALALSLPVAGAVADSGGVPHPGSQGKGKQQKQNGQNGQCPTDKSKGNGVDSSRLPATAQWDNGQGKKCGFVFGGLKAAS